MMNFNRTKLLHSHFLYKGVGKGPKTGISQWAKATQGMEPFPHYHHLTEMIDEPTLWDWAYWVVTLILNWTIQVDSMRLQSYDRENASIIEI